LLSPRISNSLCSQADFKMIVEIGQTFGSDVIRLDSTLPIESETTQ